MPGSASKFVGQGRIAILWLVTWVFYGCGAQQGTPSTTGAEIEPEVGFVDFAPSSYRLRGIEATASSARLFYAVLGAQPSRERAPTFVLTGGGPAASVMFLLGYHGPYSLGPGNPAPSEPVVNPWSLTRLGNVVAIEARNAGFSYELLDDPSDPVARAARFAPADYNPYRDAADCLHALLELGSRHPGLFAGPLYFLTESYGAVRVTALLELLHDAETATAENSIYFEESLRQTLLEVKPRIQVGGQILLQPWFAGLRQATVAGELFEQPGSILDELAAAAGSTYHRCGTDDPSCDPYTNAVDQLESFDRCVYDYRAGNACSELQVAEVSNAVTSPPRLAKLCDVDPRALAVPFGRSRAGAYRFADPARSLFLPEDGIEAQFGSLEPWDHYFVPLNIEARDAFVSSESAALGVTPNNEEWGARLLANVKWVPTFLSRAKYDLLIYAPAIVTVFESYADIASVRSLPGVLEFEYRDGQTVHLTAPEYEGSHALSRDQPAELVSDIERFVTATR